MALCSQKVIVPGLKSLTGAEYSELLDWRNEVQVCGEEVHKRSRINHKHEHAKTIQPHLLPEKNTQKETKTSFFPTEHKNISSGITSIRMAQAQKLTLCLNYTKTSIVKWGEI